MPPVSVQNGCSNFDAAPAGPWAQGPGAGPFPAGARPGGAPAQAGGSAARRLGLVLAVAVCAGFGAGCRTAGPGHGSTAAVVLNGSSPMEAARAVSDVFQAAGYKPMPLGENKDMRLEFERPGGGMANFLYGDFAANQVWSRVRIRIADVDQGKLLVTCDVFRVRDHGGGVLEREEKISPYKKRPYRDLLEQVKARASHER